MRLGVFTLTCCVCLFSSSTSWKRAQTALLVGVVLVLHGCRVEYQIWMMYDFPGKSFDWHVDSRAHAPLMHPQAPPVAETSPPVIPPPVAHPKPTVVEEDVHEQVTEDVILNAPPRHKTKIIIKKKGGH